MKCIEVVAAIILHQNKILCVQRGSNKFDYISYKYEFPGGKIEVGETKEETITREIFEELKMEIIVREEFMTVVHQYPDFLLTMHSFLCTSNNTKLTLTEHVEFQWLNKEELINLDWAAADIPIMEELIKFQI